MIITLSDALDKLGISAYVKNNDYDTIVWINEDKTISKADLESKVAEMQKAEDAIQYQKDRADAFPSLQDQLDMQYWDKKNGTKTWEETIDKIKKDFPKPE